jgi:hypothetical protein
MLELNFSNVEELIFYNLEVQQVLPIDMYSFFEQWRMSKRIPYLKAIGQQAVLDFLNSLNDQHIEALEAYFGEPVFVDRLNYSLSYNLKIPIEKVEICKELCKVQEFNYYNTWRDEKFLYISFWR